MVVGVCMCVMMIMLYMTFFGVSLSRCDLSHDACAPESSCAVTGAQERASEGCEPDTPPRQDRAVTRSQRLNWHHTSKHTRLTTSLHVGLPQTTAISQLPPLLPNLACAMSEHVARQRRLCNPRFHIVQSLPPATAVRFTEDLRSPLIPSDTNCSKQRVRTYPTRTCQQACTTLQCTAARVRVPDVAVLPASATPRSPDRGHPCATAPISTTSVVSTAHLHSSSPLAMSSVMSCVSSCGATRRLTLCGAHTRRASPPGQAGLQHVSECGYPHLGLVQRRTVLPSPAYHCGFGVPSVRRPRTSSTRGLDDQFLRDTSMHRSMCCTLSVIHLCTLT